MKHKIHSDLLTERVRVVLVGAGGNGSQMLTGLARLHLALKALGHPGGLSVRVYDPDIVSSANVGRQLFSPADIGHPKAVCLVHRLNCYYGLNWEAVVERFGEADRAGFPGAADILITCVDSAASRREIYGGLRKRMAVKPVYWLDLGNRQNDGQVILGQVRRACEEGKVGVTSSSAALKGKGKQEMRPLPCLPNVMDIYPDLLNESLPEDDRPSCSLAEALEQQDLFVNQAVVTWGLHLLWSLFRDGAIEHHGYLINLRDGVSRPIPVPEGA